MTGLDRLCPTGRNQIEPMKHPQKVYQSVKDFERQTSYCPLHLPWRVLDEARGYFRTPVPETYADKLALRAEAVFAGNPFWQRRFKSRRGRDAILICMRHWVAGMLANERPALFRDLPESFMASQPWPRQRLAHANSEAKSGLDLPCPSHYSPHYVKECAAGRGWFGAGRRNGRPRRRDLSRLKQISTKTHGWQRSWVFWPLAATASHLKI